MIFYISPIIMIRLYIAVVRKITYCDRFPSMMRMVCSHCTGHARMNSERVASSFLDTTSEAHYAIGRDGKLIEAPLVKKWRAIPDKPSEPLLPRIAPRDQRMFSSSAPKRQSTSERRYWGKQDNLMPDWE